MSCRYVGCVMSLPRDKFPPPLVCFLQAVNRLSNRQTQQFPFFPFYHRVSGSYCTLWNYFFQLPFMTNECQLRAFGNKECRMATITAQFRRGLQTSLAS